MYETRLAEFRKRYQGVLRDCNAHLAGCKRMECGVTLFSPYILETETRELDITLPKGLWVWLEQAFNGDMETVNEYLSLTNTCVGFLSNMEQTVDALLEVITQGAPPKELVENCARMDAFNTVLDAVEEHSKKVPQNEHDWLIPNTRKTNITVPKGLFFLLGVFDIIDRPKQVEEELSGLLIRQLFVSNFHPVMADLRHHNNTTKEVK